MRTLFSLLCLALHGSCVSHRPVDDQEFAEKNLEELIMDLDSKQLIKPSYLMIHALKNNFKDQRLATGDSMTVTCAANSSPSPDIYWSLNGRVIKVDKQRNLIEKVYNIGKKVVAMSTTISVLHIPCVDHRHSGRLQCMMRARNLTVTQEAKVEVVGNSRGLCRRPKIADTPPEIHFWREDIVENSDNSVQLPCRATPGAFISWFNSERTPVTALPNMEMLENGDLLITKLAWEHMGSYTCIASNERGQDQKELFLYPTSPEISEEEKRWIEEEKKMRKQASLAAASEKTASAKKTKVRKQ